MPLWQVQQELQLCLYFCTYLKLTCAIKFDDLTLEFCTVAEFDSLTKKLRII